MNQFLKEVRYFLLDMDGTVYLGDHILPGAQNFLDLLEVCHMPFYFITDNSSRSRLDCLAKFAHLDFQTDDKLIFTSGEATALYLNKQKPGARRSLASCPLAVQQWL